MLRDVSPLRCTIIFIDGTQTILPHVVKYSVPDSSSIVSVQTVDGDIFRFPLVNIKSVQEEYFCDDEKKRKNEKS